MARTVILALCALTLLIAVQQASAGTVKSSRVLFPILASEDNASRKIVSTGVLVVCKLKPFTAFDAA